MTSIGSKTDVYLHHCIIGRPLNGMQVDHRNGDGLDNRRCNLRIVTVSQNQHNSKIRCDNSTGFKGVSFNKRISKYTSQIQIEGKRVFLGYFNTPEDAAKAYQERRP